MKYSIKNGCDVMRSFGTGFQRFRKPVHEVLGNLRQKIHAGAMSQVAKEALGTHGLRFGVLFGIEQANQSTFPFATPLQPGIRPLLNVCGHFGLPLD